MCGGFEWPYFRLCMEDGHLYDEYGGLAFPEKTFKHISEAERWLETNNIRGTVTDVIENIPEMED